MSDDDDKQAQAFEYVLGTLSGEEREAFIAEMRVDDRLAEAVRYWEATLMPAPETVPPVAPKMDTFKQIQATINDRHSTSVATSPISFWERLLPWKSATAIAFAMLLVVSGLLLDNNLQRSGLNSAPNADYVAVLVNEHNEPVLTALTASDGSKLWLKWENWQAPEGHSLQLWSQSRRDGEIRPLLVFEGNEQQEVALDQATWRLIKDSSHLIITREEEGGSAMDEPSEQVIATGVCIRLERTGKSA